MDITFTRTDQGACKASAVRDDGSTVAVIGNLGRRKVLPHDLVHYVVESELRLERGFWGCIAAGALLGVAVTSGQQKMSRHHSRMLVKQAKREGTEIEDLVACFMELARREIGGFHGKTLIPDYFLQRRTKKFSPLEVSRTIAALLDAQCRWEGLGPGESMTVTWPVGLRAKKNRPETRKRALGSR
jgi:hypothetical protein